MIPADSITRTMPTPTMITRVQSDLALARLLQLVSPSLPIGGYTYSQGIEWAVEAGWIADIDDLRQWLSGLLDSNLLYLELPVLKRMLEAWSNQDYETLAHWNSYLVANRETHELRSEESNRARAFYQVLVSLEPEAAQHRVILLGSQSACFSFACQRWEIDFERAATGFLWSWVENLVLAAVKIIPLGQTAGQQTIFELSKLLPAMIQKASALDDSEIGASSMALAIASARHENQYTRLFRS